MPNKYKNFLSNNILKSNFILSSKNTTSDVLKYSDVEKFLEKRSTETSEEVIEVVDDDD